MFQNYFLFNAIEMFYCFIFVARKIVFVYLNNTLMANDVLLFMEIDALEDALYIIMKKHK